MTVQEMVEKVAEVYGADSCQLVLMRFIAVRYEKGLGRTCEDCEAHFNSLMEKAKQPFPKKLKKGIDNLQIS